jgi:hypothetical protein
MKPVYKTDKYVSMIVDEELWLELSAIAASKNLDLNYVAREMLIQGLKDWTKHPDLLPDHPAALSA